jgi:nucleoside-diphosphate-sugar epimerase
MSAGKVAVLGGSSFLAKHLAQKLDTHDISNYGREGPRCFDYPKVIPGVSELVDCDAIVLTAAAGVQAGGGEEVYGINTFFPIRLVQQLESEKFKGTLITFGSYFEIGDCPHDRMLTEAQLVHSDYPAANAYVVSKRLLTRFWSSYNGSLRWFHLVLPSLYGKGENPARIISYLINSLREGTKLRVSEGTQVRQYLHVNDVISFVRMILNSEIRAGIYNLAPANSISIAELRSKVIDAVGGDKKFELEIVPSRDEGQKVLKIDNAKASAAGWQPTLSIDAGIKTYFE